MSETLTLTKLYVAEVHTTAYSVLFGAWTEEALEAILQRHAEYELDQFAIWSKDAGFDDYPGIQVGIQRMKLDGSPWYKIQGWLSGYYDLFRTRIQIIRVHDLMANQLWCVENYDFADSAINEGIPEQIFTSNGEHVEQYKRTNVGERFSVSEVFLYNGHAGITFEFPALKLGDFRAIFNN